MLWNWQQEDWPRFAWDARKLVRAEMLFAEGAGVAIGASKHLEAADREDLTIELMSLEAVDTSAIEGEALDRDSVQSSIRKNLGLAGGGRRVGPAEAGIAEVMVDLYGHVGAPLGEVTLHRWRRLIVNGRTDLVDIGCYRRGGDPMQIVSGPIGRQRVHFEAPAASRVPAEMAAFWAWLERTGPAGATPLPPVTRAGLAHIWFESIHPYEDGNGRIGRAVSEKLLAQGLPTPVVTGMAGTLLLHRMAYYAALEKAHTDLDVTDWLRWFAAKAVEAQRRALQQVEFVLAKVRLMAGLHGRINARQEKALLRLFEAGPGGFTGGLSAANYMSITAAPSATATRDLAGLVSLGALLRTGDLKSTRYRLNVPLMTVASVEAEDMG
jgi:Fic family protein